MEVVIGLGNPGRSYAATRHNIGFMVVDYLARRQAAVWRAEPALHSHVALCQLAGRPVLLAKPQTYMNRSGQAAQAIGQHYQCEPGGLLVVFDDFLLDFGRLRFRRGGSDGGHNGLASVLEELGTSRVPRLRLGIGQPPEGMDAIDYVLAPFGPDQEAGELAETAGRAVDYFLAEGVEAAMNRFNGL